MNNVCKLFTEEEGEDLLLSLADIKEVSDGEQRSSLINTL